MNIETYRSKTNFLIASHYRKSMSIIHLNIGVNNDSRRDHCTIPYLPSHMIYPTLLASNMNWLMIMIAKEKKIRENYFQTHTSMVQLDNCCSNEVIVNLIADVNYYVYINAGSAWIWYTLM